MNDFLVRRDDCDLGRFSRAHLIRMIRGGQVSATDRISNDDGKTWQAIDRSSFASYVVTRAGANLKRNESAMASPAVSGSRAELSPGLAANNTDARPMPEPSSSAGNSADGRNGSVDVALLFAKALSFAKSKIGISLATVITVVILFGAGSFVWRMLFPEQESARTLRIWTAEYKKAEELCGQFQAATRTAKKEAYWKTVGDYAEKLQIEGQVLGSLALDIPDPVSQMDCQKYALAMTSIGDALGAMLRLRSEEADQNGTELASLFIAGCISISSKDPNAIASILEDSIRENRRLSQEERMIGDRLVQAFRSLKAADTVIRIKHTGKRRN